MKSNPLSTILTTFLVVAFGWGSMYLITKGIEIMEGTRIGYYRQDFSTLNFEETVYNTLKEVAGKMSEEDLRSHAAGFLLTSEILKTKIELSNFWPRDRKSIKS